MNMKRLNIRNIHGKKGEDIGLDSESEAAETASKSVDYIVYFTILVPITLVLVIAASYYVNQRLYVSPAVEHELYAERVMNCFAAYDALTDRHIPVLDPLQITEPNLESCFVKGRKGVRVILQDASSNQQLADVRVWTEDLPSKRRAYPVAYRTPAGTIRRGVLEVDIS